MATSIHPTAIVEEGAKLGEGVTVGPFCRVGPDVRLGDGVFLESHAVIAGHTSIGARTSVHPFAVIGSPPQHLRYRGEPTRLEIGEDVVIREHATMNPGTVAGGGLTRVGDRGFFMIGAHVAHDCKVGDGVILANNATLGGHVEVGDGAFLGGLCGIHQFCRIGAYAFIGGCAAVVADVIPYGSAYGNHAKLSGLNIIGLKRRETPRQTIHTLRAVYRALFADIDTLKERVEDVRATYGHVPEARRILDFVDATAARSLMTPAR